MLTQPKVIFLQEKIMELQQALFFDLGSSVLKLPTSVINALHVDEIGQVWFFINRPMQNVNEFEREFRSRLDFYKKGKSFYLHLTGRACIVSDPEEINSIVCLEEEYKRQANGKVILVKLKIDNIFYYPVRTAAPAITQEATKINLQPSAFIKTLQYIVKDIIPVFQSH
jgi:general stress protein 26